MSPAASRRSNAAPPPPSPASAPAVMVVAVLLCLPVGLFGLPWPVLLLIGLWVASRYVVQPELHGKDDDGSPAPANPSEREELDRFRRWKGVVSCSLSPASWFQSGLLVSHLVAAGLAAAAWVSPAAWSWVRPVSAVSAFMVVSGVAAALRRVGTDSTPCPGAGLIEWFRVWRTSPVTMVVLLLLGAVGGAVVSVGVAAAAKSGPDAAARLWLTQTWPDIPAGMIAPNQMPSVVWLSVVVSGAAVAATTRFVVKKALVSWVELVQAKAAWGDRWSRVAPKLNHPVLVDHQVAAEGVVLDTFECQGSGRAEDFTGLGGKMSSVFGAQAVALMDCPVADPATGEAVPGTASSTKFQVAVWPDALDRCGFGQWMDPAAASLALNSAAAILARPLGLSPVPTVAEIRPLVATAETHSVDGSHGAAQEDEGEFDGASFGEPAFNEDAGDEDTGDGDGGDGDGGDGGGGKTSTIKARAKRWWLAVRTKLVSRRIPQVDHSGEPWAWAVTWTGMDGQFLRSQFGAGLAGLLGVQSAAASASNDNSGTLFIGDLDTDLSTERLCELDDSAERLISDAAKSAPEAMTDPQVVSWYFEMLRLESDWAKWWQDATTSINTPALLFKYRRKFVAGRVEGWQHVFNVPRGLAPSLYTTPKIEGHLATAITSTPPMVSCHPYIKPNGDRHQSAVVVNQASAVAPALQAFPGPSKAAASSPRFAGRSTAMSAGMAEEVFAAKVMVQARINAGFDAAKLARPDVIDVECVTTKVSRLHLWEVKLTLREGVTISDVRKQAARMLNAMGASWCRAVEAPNNGCLLAVGAEPSQVRFVDEASRTRVASYDWENVWLDAGQTGTGGALPRLLSRSTMPHNELVESLIFKLPPGLSLPGLKSARKKVEVAAAKGFVEVRAVHGEATQVEVLVADSSPMPELAPYDFDFDGGDRVFGFASSITGEPLSWDPHQLSHLALFGLSNSGKSGAAKALLYGAVASGARCYVVDTQKLAGDFQFAKPQVAGIATTMPQAVALMEFVRQEVIGPAKELNAQYGVNNIRDLPADIRPPETYVFLDEFLGLIMTDPKGPSTKPESDPELEAERMRQVAEFDAKKRIAFLTGRFAAEGRSAGVHLVMMTQKLTSSMLDGSLGDLKTNLARVLLGKSTRGDRMAGLKEPDLAPDLGDRVPFGRGVFEPASGPSELVQFWFRPDAEYRQALAERVPPREPDDFSAYLPREGAGLEFVELDIAEFTEPAAEFQVEDLAQMDVDIDLGEIVFQLDDELVEGSVVEEAAGVSLEFPAVPDLDGAGRDVPVGAVAELGEGQGSGWRVVSPSLSGQMVDADRPTSVVSPLRIGLSASSQATPVRVPAQPIQSSVGSQVSGVAVQTADDDGATVAAAPSQAGSDSGGGGEADGAVEGDTGRAFLGDKSSTSADNVVNLDRTVQTFSSTVPWVDDAKPQRRTHRRRRAAVVSSGQSDLPRRPAPSDPLALLRASTDDKE